MKRAAELLALIFAALFVWGMLWHHNTAQAAAQVIERAPVVEVDTCGRVVGTAYTPAGEYRSPEQCAEIRAAARIAEERAKEDRQNLLLVVAMSIALFIIGVALATL